MNQDLARAQQALLEAILGRGSTPIDLAGLPGIEGGLGQGLRAYQLNARALAAKALASVHPRAWAELGEPDFAAMAWAFWRWQPPAQGDLAQWGGALADFLDAQEGMDPALSDAARLDWARHRAERALDAALDVASLGLLRERDATALRLRLMPGLQVLRPRAAPPLLVWRQAWRAVHGTISESEACFVEALLAGQSLALALQRAEDFDFPVWLQAALREGWLQAVEPIEAKETQEANP